jgi:excinuclease ABC subunit B
MAKSPEKKSPPAKDSGFGSRSRRSPLTDYLDAAEPLRPSGFEEAPQAELTGAPLTGSISDWAEQIEKEAEKAPARPRPGKKIPERSSAPTKTARGTSMGGAASAKDRAAAGLNPVAGLDISLEDADTLSNSGVTATVAALSALIESGNPLHKNGQMWTPHRPERPEKSEGGRAITMVSDFEPAGDQPTAIRDLVSGIR